MEKVGIDFDVRGRGRLLDDKLKSSVLGFGAAPASLEPFRGVAPHAKPDARREEYLDIEDALRLWRYDLDRIGTLAGLGLRDIAKHVDIEGLAQGRTDVDARHQVRCS